MAILLPDLGCPPILGAWPGWGPGSWVMTKKILREMGDPMIFAPLGTTTKTGKQANYRSTWMETKNGAQAHNAVFPTVNKHSWFMNNAESSFRKESRENHPKWSKGDKDRQVSYGIILGINWRWIQMSLLPETRPHRLRKETFGHQDIKMGGHGEMSYFRLIIYTLLFGSDGKASVYDVGDLGLTPGSGRSTGEGNGNPLQCYCLENPMDRGAW